MLNQKKLNEINIGEDFMLFLLVNKFEIKTAKNNKPFINLELRDDSISLPAKVWDNVDDISKKLYDGAVVKIAGVMEDFNGSSQIRINKIRLAVETDEVTAEDFLPKSSRNFEEMQKEFYEIIDSIVDPYLKQLLEIIFSGENLKKYFRTPAGKSWHHSYLHGLLEHTLEIVKICELMCSFHKEIKRDLLIAGALLHDFGKTEELSFESNFDYTDKGKLIGHIMIGAMIVEKTASIIPGFPENLKNELLHLVLSHQGKLEFASPVEPKTLEAIVLYQADELSAKTNAYKYAILVEKNKDSNWTKFLPLANTSLYIPKEENQ